MPMNLDQLFQVGYILKPHGVRGVLKFIANYELDDAFLDTNALFLEEGNGNVPYIIQSIEHIGKHEYLVKFEDVDDKEAADKLRKKPVSLTEEQYNDFVIDDETDAGYANLIGFDLLNQDKQIVGTIKDIMVLPEQELAQIFVNNREVLVPLQDDLILEINEKKQYVQVDIPDGLLDMYLEG
jgi:16S rRNA processing protein RimM